VQLIFSAAYKKDLRLAEARNRDLDLLVPPISLLLNGLALPPQYKDHQLRGNWKNHRGLHVQGDWVLIYRFEDDDALVLVRTGSHSDLFKK
jgi:mRNA interferase YafQ